MCVKTIRWSQSVGSISGVVTSANFVAYAPRGAPAKMDNYSTDVDFILLFEQNKWMQDFFENINGFGTIYPSQRQSLPWTGLGTSLAQNENLRPLFNKNVPLYSGKHGLRNHFWPLEIGFLTRKSEIKGPNFLGRYGQILKFTYLESPYQIRQVGWNRIFGSSFRFDMSSGPNCVKSVQ